MGISLEYSKHRDRAQRNSILNNHNFFIRCEITSKTINNHVFCITGVLQERNYGGIKVSRQVP